MTSSTEARPLVIPDLTDQQTFVDDVPVEAFAAIRAMPGLYWQPTTLGTANGGFWAVTRFADIVEIEKDPATFTSTKGGAYPGMNQSAENNLNADNLMMTDPPRHSQLRRAAAKGFGPRVVANFEPWVREIVHEVLDEIDQKDEFDWVKEVAETIPARVLARVLGTPREDSQEMIDLTIEMFAAGQELPSDDDPRTGPERMGAVFMKGAGYAARMQEYKRQNPADDMFTELGACVERGEINQQEFLWWMVLMMVAGFETTHTAIGQSMRLYLENSEVAEFTARAVEEGVTSRAVDEYLRLVTPPMEMARTATKDTMVGSQEVKKDDVLVMYFIAANRDPAVFSEPDRFNPWRTEKDTLAFGSGVHRCIGSYLAKLEIQILLEEMHARGRKLKLNGEPKRGWSIFINQLTSLPVAWV